MDLSVPHSHGDSIVKDLARIVGDPFDNGFHEERCVTFYWRLETGSMDEDAGSLNVYATFGRAYRALIWSVRRSNGQQWSYGQVPVETYGRHQVRRRKVDQGKAASRKVKEFVGRSLKRKERK